VHAAHIRLFDRFSAKLSVHRPTRKVCRTGGATTKGRAAAVT